MWAVALVDGVSLGWKCRVVEVSVHPWPEKQKKNIFRWPSKLPPALCVNGEQPATHDRQTFAGLKQRNKARGAVRRRFPLFESSKGRRILEIQEPPRRNQKASEESPLVLATPRACVLKCGPGALSERRKQEQERMRISGWLPSLSRMSRERSAK